MLLRVKVSAVDKTFLEFPTGTDEGETARLKCIYYLSTKTLF